MPFVKKFLVVQIASFVLVGSAWAHSDDDCRFLALMNQKGRIVDQQILENNRHRCIVRNTVVRYQDVIINKKSQAAVQPVAPVRKALRVYGDHPPSRSNDFYFVIGKGRHIYFYLKDPTLNQRFGESFVNPDKVEPGMCFLYDARLQKFQTCIAVN